MRGKARTVFPDTNVFVYAADDSDPRKHRIALGLLEQMLDGGDYLISSQVLNEFSNVSLKKLKKSDEEVRDFVSLLRAVKTMPVVPEWTSRALEIKSQYGVQFFDALLLVAAEAGHCETFLSEDLNDGQIYCGVKVVNPFKTS